MSPQVQESAGFGGADPRLSGLNPNKVYPSNDPNCKWIVLMCQAQEKAWGAGRVQVMSLWTQIVEELSAGKSLKSIYRELSINDLSYEQFSRLVAKYKKSPPFFSSQSTAELRPVSHRPPMSSVVSDRSVGALHTRHSSNGHSSDRHSTNKRPPSFKHNPLPQQDYFASSSKAKGGAR